MEIPNLRFFSWQTVGMLLILCIFFTGIFAQRPPPNKRLFNSTSIDKLLSDFIPKMKDPKLAELFSNCLPNTLDTTVLHFSPGNSTSPPDTFVITGDITAMWLRDSMNQVLPYLPYAKEDLHLRTMLCGLIHRQANNILLGKCLKNSMRTKRKQGNKTGGKNELN